MARAIHKECQHEYALYLWNIAIFSLTFFGNAHYKEAHDSFSESRGQLKAFDEQKCGWQKMKPEWTPGRNKVFKLFDNEEELGERGQNGVYA